MKTKTVPTYTATICCGLKEGYSGTTWPHSTAKMICQEYVNSVGLAVTYTETTFLYTNGREPGFAVGLINYPRFPSTPERIREHALALAALLKERLSQRRVTVVFPDETVMLGDAADPEPA